MSTPIKPQAVQAGFTLIELLIVLVIVGVLSAIAYPSYQNAVQRSRRADAFAALTKLMQAQESWRAKYPAYRASFAASEAPPEPALSTGSADNHYVLSFADVTASGYTALATVRDGSPQTSDAKCQVLKVVVAGGNISYRSVSSGAAVNGVPDPCWLK
jgi:type IV pilus assembly protein PilE